MRAKVAQAGRRLALDLRDLLHLRGRGQQRQLARLGVSSQMPERHVADAAGWLVDGAQERQVVLRIDEQPQVGEHVAVFFALEERQAA